MWNADNLKQKEMERETYEETLMNLYTVNPFLIAMWSRPRPDLQGAVSDVCYDTLSSGLCRIGAA